MIFVCPLPLFTHCCTHCLVGLKASETEDIVDAEEFALMKELREAKRSYKNGYETLQRTKTAVTQVQAALDAAKIDIASGFSAYTGSSGKFFSSTGGNNQPQTSMGGSNGMGGAGGDKDGELDDQEAFDRLEEDRVMASDPDSLAFFHANKTKQAHLTQNFVSLRQMQRNKRAL